MSDLADTIATMSALRPPSFDRMVGTVVVTNPVTIDDGKGHRLVMNGWDPNTSFSLNQKALALNVLGKWYAIMTVIP